MERLLEVLLVHDNFDVTHYDTISLQIINLVRFQLLSQVPKFKHII